jgi:GST-like protein
MLGQLGYFFHFAGKEIADKRPLERYAAEGKRLLGVLDARLERRAWIMGDDYSIADIAVFPWLRNVIANYKAGEILEIAARPNVARALDAFLARPAVIRGLTVPAKPQGGS